jgi:hypothetical protein
LKIKKYPPITKMSNTSIDAAFHSANDRECYIFVKDKYVVVNYAPGGQKKDIIVAPKKIVDGFPMFKNTIFANGIDCAFDTKENQTFIFSGNQCAKTDRPPYSTNARLILGPIPINAMFPCLIGTVFENGIDATMRSTNDLNSRAFIFKGDNWGDLDIYSNHLYYNMKISAAIPKFYGTVFESGVDAALNLHGNKEVYLFKGKYYAHYDFSTQNFLNGLIKGIRNDWPALHGILQ